MTAPDGNLTVTKLQNGPKACWDDPAAVDLSYTDSKLHEIATFIASDSDLVVYRRFSELTFSISCMFTSFDKIREGPLQILTTPP
jgi:hypothetical protein